MVNYEFKIITSMIIRDDRGRFLLGKRSMDEEVFPGLWSIPGGKVEHGPAMSGVLEDNVKKEVLEEFGCDVAVDSYFESHSDGKGKVYVVFLGHITNGVPQPLEDTDAVEWFTLTQVRDVELTPPVWDLLVLADKR
jgi:8-oxo-dGTP diphosphatase